MTSANHHAEGHGLTSMKFAPIRGCGRAITATVAKNGLLVLWKLIVFMGGFYLSLMILWGNPWSLSASSSSGPDTAICCG